MKNWFDQYGRLQKAIPKQAWQACSAPGRNDEAVEYWSKELNFVIPPRLIPMAKAYLAEFGAWDSAELDEWERTENTEHELAKHVFWLFCGDIREGRGGCLYLGH